MSVTPTFRVPRSRILVNGSIINGAFDIRVRLSNCFQAGQFSVALSLNARPDFDHRFWSVETEIVVDIQLSMTIDQDFVSLIKGTIDSVSMDPIGKTVNISGRDFTSTFIESATQENFTNRTASEIAGILAARHGLTACITPTRSVVGRFYESNYDSITLNSLARSTTEWELLVYLAQQENYDAYVSGTCLYFEPILNGQVASKLIRVEDVMELRLHRSLMLSREISVTVKSWNTQEQTGYIQKATGTPASILPSSYVSTRAPAEYLLIHPNLSPTKASGMALRYMNELVRHERTLEFLMPGDLTLGPRDMVRLVGTASEFDQEYYVTSIDRTLNAKRGYQQRVIANNTSPRSITVTTI